MNKKTEPQAAVWDVADEVSTAIPPTETLSPKETKAKKTSNSTPSQTEPQVHDLAFDMEGLMTDFPTATELQKFVYDSTGVVLNLKGRANKVKYQIALDVLNGNIPPMELLGSENPYLDKNDLIPEEPLGPPPASDPTIKTAGGLVTRFGTNSFPHPDPEWRSEDQKCLVVFRKYANSMITYEILGPLGRRAIGSKINKFGQPQPEKIIWVDPRTGEQVIRRGDGTLTPIGTRLRAHMQKLRVNKSNQWDIWIDRDFVVQDGAQSIDNPWGS